jgi:hypothetical protein
MRRISLFCFHKKRETPIAQKWYGTLISITKSSVKYIYGSLCWLQQQEKERAERAQQQKEVALPPSAGIWSAASQSLSWASCSNTTTVWGSTTPATTGSLSMVLEY